MIVCSRADQDPGHVLVLPQPMAFIDATHPEELAARIEPASCLCVYSDVLD